MRILESNEKVNFLKRSNEPNKLFVLFVAVYNLIIAQNCLLNVDGFLGEFFE